MSSTVPSFIWGMSSRFLLSCAAWTAIRLVRAAFSRKPKESIKKAFIKNSSYLKMWISSFALETGVSVLTLPGPFIVGRHVTRIMMDSFMPIVSDFVFKIDKFSTAGFLLFASQNLIRASSPNQQHQNLNKYNHSKSISAPMITDPLLGGTTTTATTNTASSSTILNEETAATSFANNNSSNGQIQSSTTTTTTTTGAGGAAAVSNAFLYQLPTTLLHLAKLFYRTHRLGMKRTRFFRCLGVIGLQYVVRVPLMSFATMLPMSDTELAFCVTCIIVDKTAESYLWYHTFPLPDVVSEAGIYIGTSSSSSSPTTVTK